MKNNKKFFLTVLIILIMELFVFNFRFFVVKFSKAPFKEITKSTILSDAVVKDNDKEDKKDKDNIIQKHIKFQINENVQSIKLNFDDETKQNIHITINFIDDGEIYSYKKLNSIVYNKTFDKSEYFVLRSQGNCRELYLDLESEEDFSLKNIEINTWYFEFNFVRFLILTLISFIIIYWKDLDKINLFFEKNKKAKILAYLTIISISIICYGIFCYNNKTERFTEDGWVDPYSLLTESILHGRVDLNYEYKNRTITQDDIDALNNLKNYKDISERDAENIRYYFDTAFYNGKYYCYYGIVPVITVMLPYAIITGNIPLSNLPCFIYFSVFMIVLLFIYLEIIKRFKLRLKFLQEVGLYLVLFMATGISVFMISPRFYQAADLSGITWGFIGIYSLMILKNNNHISLKLLVSGISFGLMVCSRPLYILYLPIFIILAFKYLIEDRKINFKRCLIFALPILIIAILQMIYNYVRFDNIFEFGQFYQLTINDPSAQQFDLGMSIKGIIAYIFNLPQFINTFPFIQANFYYIDVGNVIYTEGVFGLICYPFLWSMFIGRKLLKDNYTLKILWILLIVLALIILSTNTCLAGMNQRYTVDIQPFLAIMSLIIWIFYLKKNKNDKYSKKILIYICIITCIVSFLITMVKFMEPLDSKTIFDTDFGNIVYAIKHALCFYE